MIEEVERNYEVRVRNYTEDYHFTLRFDGSNIYIEQKGTVVMCDACDLFDAWDAIYKEFNNA